MPLTDAQLGILCCERLKLPHSAALGFQTYIESALNNLALDTVNDAQKRRWLITDPSTTTATVTSSNGQYYVDLSTLVADPQIMIDYLRYGTVYVTGGAHSWGPSNVDAAADTIEISGNGYATGQAVQLTTGATLPFGLSASTTYYLIVDGDLIQFCTSLANTRAGVVIDLLTAGMGTSLITPYGSQRVLQWLTSANQGSLTSAVPIAYPTGWLVDTRIYLNNVTVGTLSFAVPFVPTVSSLPDFLQNDAVDQMVNLAIAGGQELPKEAAER